MIIILILVATGIFILDCLYVWVLNEWRWNKSRIRCGDTVQILKRKKSSAKRGGVLFRMPKIFRYSLYSAYVLLVWRLVFNIDKIVAFVVKNIF